jgi:hypothetical protein
MNNFLKQSVLTSLSFSFICLTNNLIPAQAQQVVKMRFVWNFVPSSGAAYLNICSDPEINRNAQTGGCAEINVLNENVTANKSRTKLVTDRLKEGVPYKACIVADNTFSDKRGRWIDCVDFVATNSKTISFSINRAYSVGNP